MARKHAKTIKKATIALITVIMLVCSFTGVNASVFFQDGFENGDFSSWTVSGTPAIVTTPTLSGNYSALFPNSTYVQTQFVQTGAATLEFYFRTDSISQSDFAEYIVWVDSSSQPGALMMFGIARASGALSWLLAYSASSSLNFQFISATILPNTWYKIDIAAAGGTTNGGYQVSINSAAVYTVNALNVIWTPTSLRMGNMVSTYTANNYIDNVTILNTANVPTPTPPLTTPSPNQQSSQGDTTTVTASPTPKPHLTSTPVPTPKSTVTPMPTPKSTSPSGTTDLVVYGIVVPVSVALLFAGIVFANRRMRKPSLP